MNVTVTVKITSNSTPTSNKASMVIHCLLLALRALFHGAGINGIKGGDMTKVYADAARRKDSSPRIVLQDLPPMTQSRSSSGSS